MRSTTKRWLTGVTLVATLTLGLTAPAQAASGGLNDFACRPSAAHPEPVVLLHGLGATFYEDLNFLQGDLANRGYCTFSTTYGAYPNFPFVGGLKAIADSSLEVKNFVEKVRAATGAAKVDVAGHSEGAFLSLYLAKLAGIQLEIGKVVALAPPTHGTTLAGLLSLALKVVGRDTFERIARAIGLPVGADLVEGGPAVVALSTGPVARPGIDYTIITSRSDELVTPTETSFVREPGVKNQYVQDLCPKDSVGHIGEAYDLNVWYMIRKALDPEHTGPLPFCAPAGAPL
ncbi:alpha/beta fold hydrolase [Amycolatopsis sp. PS_44_ISF1]|uniref:esterase/lipase family protein n=1 Tax=Amycolatopsis sp. PS_44_ISF1 TaxID=2974917 RepID=UPI0028DD4699|nr:alpha/beta fold hydrolase [Amycolatopsis sp. PS_44_ISF1]MDT8912346.1 alpha/beta fold hydrolase [Amycolatopsis sp. PS_44_ISF1]